MNAIQSYSAQILAIHNWQKAAYSADPLHKLINVVGHENESWAGMTPDKAKSLVPGIEQRTGWVEFVEVVTKAAAVDAAALSNNGSRC